MRLTWSSSPGPDEPWSAWSYKPGSTILEANLYTAVEPYERKRVGVDCGSPAKDREMAELVEAREAAGGWVTLDKLPEHVIKLWAERDAMFLLAQVEAHLRGEG